MGKKTNKSSEKKHKIYVYGTLRPGNTKTVLVPGDLYDLGWYPGLILKSGDYSGKVLCEIIEVDDERLRELDIYEGFRPDDHENSLYLRVPYLDGFIYTYNQSTEGRIRIYKMNGTQEIDWRIYDRTDHAKKQGKSVEATKSEPEEEAA